MKSAHLIGLGILLSLSATACAGKTEPNDGNSGQGKEANSTTTPAVPTSTSEPAPAPAPSPAPAPAPAPVAGCTPIAASGGSANPASVYCIELGYKNDLDTSTCDFPDGTSCEEWSFYRGECGQAHSFCALHGGTITNTVENTGSFTETYATCTLPTGKSCQESTFATTCSCE